MERVDYPFPLLNKLGIDPFQERLPWFGGDLQTLRDTFVKDQLPDDAGHPIHIDVPEMPKRIGSGGTLIAFLDLPANVKEIKGLVLMLHGLGGSSRRRGLRRMAVHLVSNGFAVLRLNLRGSDPCRKNISGTYSAQCNSDLLPVIYKSREIADSLSYQKNNSEDCIPLYGIGLSLGGTILLNACLVKDSLGKNLLDGLICISSPLDLLKCSASIERRRNSFYQNWILNRLLLQTISDPFGISEKEKLYLNRKKSKSSGDLINTIREFDSVITAPRWGYKDVYHYYNSASPIKKIYNNYQLLPPTLLVQSLDDPWVPSEPFMDLQNRMTSIVKFKEIDFVLTKKGGHNGFHGKKGCWGDNLACSWLINKAIKNIK